MSYMPPMRECAVKQQEYNGLMIKQVENIMTTITFEFRLLAFMKKIPFLLVLVTSLILSSCNKKEEFYCKIISPVDGDTVLIYDSINTSPIGQIGLTITVDAKGAHNGISVFVSHRPGWVGGMMHCGDMSMDPNYFTISPQCLLFGKICIKVIAYNSEGEETSHSIWVDVTDKAGSEESPDFVTFSDGKIPQGWITNRTWEIEKQLGYDDNYSLRTTPPFYSDIIYAVKTFDKNGYVEFFTNGDRVDLFVDGGYRNELSSEPAGNYWTKHTYSVNAGKHLFMWQAREVYTYLDAIRFYYED